ncbi:uncharacterized protein LOC104889169 [Beta vulgaris subsp. vulgaris]|uniref:uncharacterized protein LOC104889169 n=1 Tax=Beta vulgaris subsp. vulgaris TaxID=3555 RepID=UPI0020370894|nr:uncharacterized protein LOC104889169 [Beta vulgaris subsp. vulgaris]
MYKNLQEPGEKVGWSAIIWDHYNIPKHGFIAWLAMLRRLKTRDRLHNIGLCPLDQCLLCELEQENHEHLFFACHFSKQCIQLIKEWLGITACTESYTQLLRWLQRRHKGSKFRKRVMNASVIATLRLYRCVCIGMPMA